MLVDISEKDLEFIKNLSKEIKTQDNRATAEPFYYVIKVPRWDTVPDGYGDKVVYMDMENEYVEYESRKQATKDFIIHGFTQKEAETKAEHLLRLEQVKRHEVKNIFLTEKACNRHMKANKHHYNGGFNFVDYAWRNPEMESLIKAIHNIAMIG